MRDPVFVVSNPQTGGYFDFTFARREGTMKASVKAFGVYPFFQKVQFPITMWTVHS